MALTDKEKLTLLDKLKQERLYLVDFKKAWEKQQAANDDANRNVERLRRELENAETVMEQTQFRARDAHSDLEAQQITIDSILTQLDND